MSDTTASADLGPPSPTVDVQDPLPEVSWLWRRVATLAVVVPAVLVNAAVAVMLFILKDSASLYGLAKWNIGFAGVAMLLYMAGANTAEITKLLQSSRLLRDGVVTHRKAKAESAEGKVEVETTTGIPSQAAEDGAETRLRPPLAPDSQIPEPALSGAPTGSEDAAPTNRIRS